MQSVSETASLPTNGWNMRGKVLLSGKPESLMPKPTLLSNEEARLEALRRYQFLGNKPEKIFDDLTRLAAQTCSCAMAFLSIVESDHVRYKSREGAVLSESPREASFCSWAILEPDILIVPDAQQDIRFKNSPLVTANPRIRFYAGAPLVTSDGHALGALCVADHRARDLNPAQACALRTLACAVVAQLELRHKSFELERANVERQRMRDMLRLNKDMFSRIEKQNADLSDLNAMLKRQTVESQRSFELLAANVERYSLVVRSANEGLWDWDLQKNEIHFCPRWKAMLGYGESELGIHPDEWFKRVHPEDVEQVQSDILAHLMGLTSQFQSEHRMRNREGVYRWMLSRGLAVWDANGSIYRMAGSLTDITEQKEAEKQLQHSMFHDGLTGLPNRSLFMDRLKRLLARAKRREDYLFAVLLLDLDRFKAINDSLGHQVGDQLLAAIARRLETCVRPGDLVARLGGDEFAIIVDHLKYLADATQAAERIQKELAAPFNLSGNEVFASASIGVVLSLTPYEVPEDFLRNADTAMYRAKDRGRGCYELFETDMHARAMALSQLETDLRRALVHNEFRVYYQPIISLEDWRIIGLEALLRWEHPQHGSISPLEFIPVAEESGLIIPIGKWVLREACRQLRIWQEEFPSEPALTMSVNLSGKQFSQPDLIDMIEDVLGETGLDARSLKIEITESAIIENIEAATSVLKRLKLLGIRLSLDDFGTGYSSLSYLHRFPIDTLKIDRSFVTRMNLPKNSEIIRTIVSLASNLGMDVIAEGVETGEQIIQLGGMNCDYVQGFLLSKPLDSEAVRKLIEETYQKSLCHRAGAA